MANLNKVMLMGNLTRDPETRHTQGGNSITNLSVAVNRKYKTGTGETKEEVTFVDCEAWGKTGEAIAQYLCKGRGIFIEGRLRLNQWETEGGEKRSKLMVSVESFQFTDSKGDAKAETKSRKFDDDNDFAF